MLTYVVTAGVTLSVMGALMGAMAIGVALGRKPLKGSCGGVGGSCACDEAGTPGACATAPQVDPRMSAPGQITGLRRG
jgi:hypothetical protein